MSKVLRWGILSAGEISNDFVAAFHAYLSPNDHIIKGVAARNQNKAAEFCKLHGISHVYKNYEEMVEDSEIDIVYIGSIHPEHLKLSKLALDHGKHVLCEKPLCVNIKETKELISYARKKKLFLMEAIWTRYFPASYQLREEIRKGTIGEVLQVTAGMGVIFPPDNWRTVDVDACGGSVLDIGTYTVQLASMIFGGEKPIKIVASGHLNDHGVDESSSATLIYSNGKTATLTTHTRVEFPNDAIIIGTKGIIRIGPKFWAPTELVTPTQKFEYELPSTDKKLFFWNTQGLAYQCDEVKRCLEEGLTESPIMTHEESITLAEIRESIRKQIGVRYIQD